MADSNVTSKPSDDASTGRFRGGMARAVFSAAVFGAIGAYFGKWLGKRGNAEGSHMAEPILKWSMGAFWAVLAAYASLKASDPVVRESKPPASEDEKGSAIRDYSTVGEMSHALAQDVPALQVQKATAVAQGMVQQHAPKLAPQK